MQQTIAKRMVLITVILMDLLTGMEFDLFVPSFPALQSHFSLSPFAVEALLSVNFIGYCLSLFFVGGLADRYGRKPILLLGLVIFIIGSSLCLWPASYPFLLIGRFLQGLGIAAPAILSFLIIADTYPLQKQQYFMAMLNAVINTAVAIAPVLGSYITLYFQWQGNFIALFCLGLLALAMILAFVPTYKLPEHKDTLSLRGYIPLFSSKPLMLLIITIVFIFVPYWIFVGISPLLYMKNLGVSLAQFGYYQGSFALVFAIGSILFGAVIQRYSQKAVLSLSIKIFIFSLISMIFVTVINSTHPLLITLAFLPFVIGQIIPSAILYPLCLNFIPHAKGRISAIVQGARLIFAALSLQVAGYYYQGAFKNIGIILIGFISLVIITLFLVINHRELIKDFNKW
jgi:DHA1 family bicyclomycin/chloramphenicol resistance-like MFS transporter